MLPDSECLKIVYEILTDLNLNQFVIKVNHRDILGGIFKLCDIPDNQFKTVCSSIDKMDKMSWTDIKKELIEVKKINEQSVDKIYGYVKLNGKTGEFLDNQLESELASIPEAKKALESLKLFNKYCTLFKIDHSISYDFSLGKINLFS